MTERKYSYRQIEAAVKGSLYCLERCLGESCDDGTPTSCGHKDFLATLRSVCEAVDAGKRWEGRDGA